MPLTGDYTFWLNADNRGELWLSTDDDPSNVVLIARESFRADFGSWGSGEEQSDPIALICTPTRGYFACRLPTWPRHLAELTVRGVEIEPHIVLL